jgi:hypothetical protein
MNRIRKANNTYQVLITPDIKIAPDNPIMIGNWADENLRNYSVLEFETLNDAQCESMKYPDIDWYRLIVNHEHIYQRLKQSLQALIKENNFIVQFIPNLMNPLTFKNAMFDRVLNGGERFNLRYDFTDLISFTIISPWSNVLHNISNKIETHREHLYRDDLRIRDKHIVDGKTICLYGYTEFGTIYEIKLIPTILYQWGEWMKKIGHTQQANAEKIYASLIKQQQTLDNGPIIL